MEGQNVPTSVLTNLKRGGVRLRAMSKTHSPLHVLLWQAREAHRMILASAAAQKTLFNDIANWSSTQNTALSDVCSNFSQLNTLSTSAHAKLAQAFKNFRKDMTLVLEGENRSDLAHKKLQVAERTRLKIRRQVLSIQNRRQVSGESPRRPADFNLLQTQLGEAERAAERAHVAACEAKGESEAVKLVVVRSALLKLSQAQLHFSKDSNIIFKGGKDLAKEIPDPPPPGSLLSSVRYDGYEKTREILTNIKYELENNSPPPPSSSSSGPSFSSSPIRHLLTSPPTAPDNPFLVSPPPYNPSFCENSSRSNNSYINTSQTSGRY